MVEYEIKIAKGFERKFKNFVAEKSKLIAKGFKRKFKNFVAEKSKLVSECNVMSDDTFILKFENHIIYNEFLELVSSLLDIIYAKRTDASNTSNVFYYAVGVAIGQEISISRKFAEYAESNSVMEDIYVPISEQKSWDDKVVKFCISPGYIYVKSTHKEFISQAARNMNIRASVLGIVSDKEIDALKKKEKEDCNLDKKNSYSIGDRVRINNDVFEGHNGEVVGIYEEREKQLDVSIIILDREMIVKLAFSEVERLENE